MDNANGPVEETNSVPFPDNNDTRPNGVFKVTAVFDTPNNDDPPVKSGKLVWFSDI
jgi:hypothetical protein